MDIININETKNSEYIDWISNKIYTTWEKECNDDGYYSEKEFKNKLIKQFSTIPVTFGLVFEKKIIGTISIELNDLKSNKLYTPWVASFYIDNDYRSKGFGEKLLNHVILYAKYSLNLKVIYLWTEKNNLKFYIKRNWEIIEIKTHLNKKIYILKYRLNV